MIEIVLAAALAALTPAQQTDLGCVDISATLSEGSRLADPLAQFYLGRLRQSDSSRDWVAEAKPLNDITYDDLIERLRACRARMPAPPPS